jgi:hypothetical protein
MRPSAGKRRSVVVLAIVAFAVAAGQAAAVVDSDVGGCKVTYGGWITTAEGDKATFGGNVNEIKGSLEFQDHGPATDINVHSISVTSGVCFVDDGGVSVSRTSSLDVADPYSIATITGFATIDGEDSYEYTLDLADAGEPGRADLFRLRLSNGYDSGEQPLLGGNVQIHLK